ncbi:MAG: helix-turn-helix transcriptional regulator [Pirellulaceae bacterium]
MKLEEFRMGKVAYQIARKNSSLLDELAGGLGITRAELPMDSIIPLLLERLMPRQGIETEIAADIRTLLQRITEHFTPQEVVGTDYIANRLGCSSQYISRMATEGTIPKACIKVSSGERRQRWKFFRSEIDRWIAERK